MIMDNKLQSAYDGFLSRYGGYTKKLYSSDLRIFFSWCADNDIIPLEAKRSDIELFGRYLEHERGNKPSSVSRRLSCIRMFFKVATADELIDRDPSLMLRMPKVYQDNSNKAWLNRVQMGTMIATAAKCSVMHEILVALMAMLGLRVSEACNVKIEDIKEDGSGYRVLTIVGKGKKEAKIPLPMPLTRIVDRAIADRSSGYLILRRNGKKQDRNGAYAWIKDIARKGGLPDNISPHALRRSAITAALDSGVGLRDAQDFARHSSPNTTRLYDSRKFDLDRYAGHSVSRWFIGAV